MQAHEIAILAVTSLSLLGGIGWIVYNGLRRLWPDGKRVTQSYDGPGTGGLPYEVHVIFEPGVTFDDTLARHVAKAVWAAGAAWMLAKKAGRVTADDHRIREVIVVIATGETMDDLAENMGWSSLAGRASLHKTREWGGDNIPMAQISERNIQEVMNHGEPVIHEMLHALAGHLLTQETEGHTDPIIWEGARRREGLVSEISIQEKAGDIYRSQPGSVHFS